MLTRAVVPPRDRRRTAAWLTLSLGALVAAALLHPRVQAPFGAVDCGSTSSTAGVELDVSTVRCVLPERSVETDVVVEVVPPSAPPGARPPVALAVALDRSGSMHGPALDHARAAVLAALDALGPEDAFALVAYADEPQVLVPLGRVDDGQRARTRAAVAGLFADGATNVSWAVDRAARELEAPCAACAPRRVSRVLLISDGRPTGGLRSLDALAAQAARLADRGASLTVVGVGPEFDEQALAAMATAGRGDYHYVDDVAGLPAVVAADLGGLAGVVATEVSLALQPAPGVELVEVAGRAGAGREVPVADLRAGQPRKVVVRVRAAAASSARQPLLSVRLRWRGAADGRVHELGGVAAVQRREAGDPGPVVATAARAAWEAELARGLAEAADAAERGDRDGAAAALRPRLVEAARAAAELSDPVLARTVEAARQAAAAGGAPGAASLKATRKAAYDLAR